MHIYELKIVFDILVCRLAVEGETFHWSIRFCYVDKSDFAMLTSTRCFTSNGRLPNQMSNSLEEPNKDITYRFKKLYSSPPPSPKAVSASLLTMQILNAKSIFLLAYHSYFIVQFYDVPKSMFSIEFISTSFISISCTVNSKHDR